MLSLSEPKLSRAYSLLRAALYDGRVEDGGMEANILTKWEVRQTISNIQKK